MSRSRLTAFLLLIFALGSDAVLAQGVYVTKGENGPVFSDKPQSGAKEVTLRPLSVVPMPKEDKAAKDAKDAKAAKDSKLPAMDKTGEPRVADAVPAYTGFSIVQPENNGSVIANSGTFEVRLAVEPPLQLGSGHAFMISINGRSVAQRFTTTEFMIPSEFWQGVVQPENQSAQLDASIVDNAGQVLKKASPVRFMLRYTTVLNNPNWHGHRPPPLQQFHKPKPKPVPKTEPESAVGATIKKLDK